MNQKLRETHWETVQLNERSLLANCFAVAQVIAMSDGFLILFVSLSLS